MPTINRTLPDRLLNHTLHVVPNIKKRLSITHIHNRSPGKEIILQSPSNKGNNGYNCKTDKY